MSSARRGPTDAPAGRQGRALLADRGRHRAVGAADLVLAAVAERAHLTVLHYDRDFEHIAAVTGQPIEAVVPLGSL